jgi:hypothetical protein
LENGRAEKVLSGELVPVGRRGMWGKVVGWWIWRKYCVHTYVNGKMRPVETVPEMGGKVIEENEGGGDFKYNM